MNTKRLSRVIFILALILLVYVVINSFRGRSGPIEVIVGVMSGFWSGWYGHELFFNRYDDY